MRRSVRRRGFAVGALLLGATAVPPAAAQTWPIDDGEVVVLVPLEPGGAFEATTSSLEGELRPGAGPPLELSGEVSVDLGSVDTGIALRTEHMRERLELARGPGFSHAVLSDLILSDAADSSFRGETPFTATLLFHGVSRPVSGKAKIIPAGASVRVEASFVLDLPEFEIEPPNYMGVGVTNKVVVNVSFSTKPTGSRR